MNVRLARHVLPTFAFAAVLLGSGSDASAQDPMDLHFSTFFALGAGGEFDLEDDASFDLDATVGLGLRLDVPVLKYLAIGGQVGFNFWKLEDAEDRDTLIDLPDLVVRGRVPIELRRGLLEPYAAFLIGGTISVIGEDDNKDSAYGWNVGLLFGLNYFFTDVLGILFELGWHRHAATHDFDLGPVTVEGTGSINQAAINFGLTVLF